MGNEFTSTGQPGLQSYWAYIHVSARSLFRIKRIIPDPGLFTGEGKDGLNDLEHALWEKDQGNDNIWIIVPVILWAPDEHNAKLMADLWLVDHKYYRDSTGDWCYPIREGERFAYIPVE